jgi:hypothetical protein
MHVIAVSVIGLDVYFDWGFETDLFLTVLPIHHQHHLIMLASVRASATASAALRRSLVVSSQTNGRRLFSASAIQRAAQDKASSTTSSSSSKGSSWLAITALTALAATSGYYLFSPVEGATRQLDAVLAFMECVSRIPNSDAELPGGVFFF